MKKYFIAFDFYDRYINKFYWGIQSFYLIEDGLVPVVKQIIRDNFEGIDPEKMTIKVTSLNNIEP